MKNKELKEFYNSVYKKGENTHYTKLLYSKNLSEEKSSILRLMDWKGKTVLDVGCGTGELAYLIARKGAKKVIGIDYSEAAIEIGKKVYKAPNLEYRLQDIDNAIGKFDVVMLIGVLEHIDAPLELLKKLKKFLNKGGSIIVTSPNWSNIRGHLLVPLKILFGARITLADIHYFTPLKFVEWAKKMAMKLEWQTIEQSWGHGEKMLRDLTKRLPNVLKPMSIGVTDEKIEELVNWYESQILPLEQDSKSSGAVGLYHFKK